MTSTGFIELFSKHSIFLDFTTQLLSPIMLATLSYWQLTPIITPLSPCLMSLLWVLQALWPRLKKPSAHVQRNFKGLWMMQFPIQSLAWPSLHFSRMLEQLWMKQGITSINTLSAGGAQKLLQDYLLGKPILALWIWSTLPHQSLGLCSMWRLTTSRVPLLEQLQPLAALFSMLWRTALDCQVLKAWSLHLCLWRHHIYPSYLTWQQLMFTLRRPKTCFLSTVHRAHRTSLLTRLSSLWLETCFLEPFDTRFFLICSLISKNFSLWWT